jgi:hypothetical protein
VTPGDDTIPIPEDLQIGGSGPPPRGYRPPAQPRPDGRVGYIRDTYGEPTPAPHPHLYCGRIPGTKPGRLRCEMTRGHAGFHWARNDRRKWVMYDGRPDTPIFTQQPKCPNPSCDADANTQHIDGCLHSRYAP